MKTLKLHIHRRLLQLPCRRESHIKQRIQGDNTTCQKQFAGLAQLVEQLICNQFDSLKNALFCKGLGFRVAGMGSKTAFISGQIGGVL